MFEETFRKNDNVRLSEAEFYFHRAYDLQSQGALEEAIGHYRKSIEMFPTAEAFTFLGWALSLQGDFTAAMEQCRKAIEIDADFGNPYNDIGAYLISLKRWDESVPWLEKAKSAKRYENRHYPYFNHGRVLEAQGRWSEALEQYEMALRLNPSYDTAKQAHTRVKALWRRRN